MLLNFQVGCRDKLRMNSDADKALAQWDSRSEVLSYNRYSRSVMIPEVSEVFAPNHSYNR